MPKKIHRLNQTTFRKSGKSATQFSNYKKIVLKRKPKVLEVLIDTQLILDILVDRQTQCSKYLDDLFYLIDEKKIIGYLTDEGLEYIRCLSRHIVGEDAAQNIVSEMSDSMKICSLNSQILTEAIKDTQVNNMGNAIYRECCSYYKLDALIVHEEECFAYQSKLPYSSEKNVVVLTPQRLIQNFKSFPMYSNNSTHHEKSPLHPVTKMIDNQNQDTTPKQNIKSVNPKYSKHSTSTH